MFSTRKVAILTASLIVVDCLLAGIAAAGVAGEGLGSMSETLSIALTLVVVMAALNVVLIKLLLKNYRERQNGDPLDDILGGSLEKDTDAKTLLTKMAAMIGRHDEALKPLIEDYALRKAEEKAGELHPL